MSNPTNEKIFPELHLHFDLVQQESILEALQSTVENSTSGGNAGQPNFALGNASDDWLDGKGQDDVLNGLEGNDHLLGRGGNDVLIGGSGNDYLDASGGNDHLLYQAAANLDSSHDYYDGGAANRHEGDTLWLVLTYGEYDAYQQELEYFQNLLDSNKKPHGPTYTFESFNLTVTNIENFEIILSNRGPTANHDGGVGYGTNEDTAFTTANVLDNDTDLDHLDVIKVIGMDTSHTIGNVINHGDGTFGFDPNGQYEYLAVGESTTTTFDYTISDLAGYTSTATATITIHGVNDKPIANNDFYQTNEDTVLTVFAPGLLANDTDVDASDVLQVGSIDTTNTIGTVTVQPDGQLTYDPNGQFEYLALGESATDSFTYLVDDGHGGTDTAVATITIVGQNDRPVVENIAYNVHEDANSVSGNFIVHDVDATDTHTFEIVDGPTGGTVINNHDGTFTFKPNNDFQFLNTGQTRDVSFTYRATDDSGAANDTSEIKTATITVIGADDAPIQITDNLLFTTDNQSMWASGDAFVLEPDLPFVGLQWNETGSLTILKSTTIDIGVDKIKVPGISLNASTEGKIGLQPYFNMTSGDVDANLPVNINFLTPKQVEPGQTITLDTGFFLGDDATFNTYSPNITMGLDLILQFDAGLDLSIGSNNYTLFSMPKLDTTIPLFSFSGDDLELSIDFEGKVSGADLGNITAGLPVIDTEGTKIDANSLDSSGEDSILTTTLDLDGFLSEAIAVSTGVAFPLERSWEKGLKVPVLGTNLVTLEAGYNILDIELVGDLKAVQNFQLDIDELPLLITLEDGSQLSGYSAGDSITFDIPEFDIDVLGDADGMLDFTTAVDMDAVMDNLTTLGFDLSIDMTVLAASFDVTSDLFKDFGIGFEAWSDSFELFSTDNFATLFNNEFSLLGFNTETTNFEIDTSIV